MTPQRVTLITLGVSELGVSRRFYEALGWQAHRETQDSIVFFQLNTMALGLFGRVALAEDQGRPTAQLGTGAMTLAINYGDQDEVDQAFNDALNAGATLLKRPQKVFWGDIRVIMVTLTVMSGKSLITRFGLWVRTEAWFCPPPKFQTNPSETRAHRSLCQGVFQLRSWRPRWRLRASAGQ